MTNDLRSILDDGGSAAPSIETSEAPPSETVTVTDRWTRRVGERLALTMAEPPLPKDSPLAGVLDGLHNVAADAVETLMAAAPKLAERPADEHRAQWWKQFLESPEAAALRAQTVCAPALAELGAAEIVREWSQYVGAHPPKEPPQDGSGEQQQGDGDESPEDTVARIRSTRAAAKSAEQAVEQGRALAAGIGIGTETAVDAQRLAEYAKRFKRSGVLARIMQIAGRFIARAHALQRQRTDLPGLEVTGIELSGDVARVLPLDAALVAGAVPEIEMLALYKLATRHTLSYRRERREPVGMGPLVISIDESSSMDGTPIETAKALALAMVSIARAQKRPILLAGFSGTALVRVAHDTPDEIVKWCTAQIGGGTVLDGPLATVPFKHWPSGKVGARADHIIISDACVNAPQPLVDEYKRWAKQQNVRTFAIIIGQRALGSLEAVADSGGWCVPSLDLNSGAVETILSIGPQAARRSA